MALALLASLLPAVSQDVLPHPLLPDTPEGWRPERLELPLSFAPDIELEGYEELRFAPGMFEAGAPDYWSYLFGIHVEGDHRVDEAFLQDFLERYYGGLCRAVGGERGMDAEDLETTVHVDALAHGFHACIDTVDAFVTQERITLNLEIDVDPGPRHTVLFAIASPAKKDAPVWATLRGLRDEWRAGRPAAFLFNHAYFVVDAETYAALAGSEWLRESFAIQEERTTVRRDISYSGLYFYGENTYFEFLPEGAAPQLPAGGTGLAFGFEVAGATARAAERLAAADVTAFTAPITRELDGEHLPWFAMLGVEAAHERSRLSLFTLEYDPRFLAAWHPDLPPASGGIARRAVLARYAASLGQRPRALGDVTAVHLALDPRERARLGAVVRSLGWVVAEGEDGRLHMDGPGIDLWVRPVDEPGGITGLELGLREPVEREPLELGSLRWTFEGERASVTRVD